MKITFEIIIYLQRKRAQKLFYNTAIQPLNLWTSTLFIEFSISFIEKSHLLTINLYIIHLEITNKSIINDVS